MGHTLISYQHDPDHRHLESFSVMGDNNVSMRDPTFYRWHAEVDDIFDEHKKKLNPYTAQQLTFSGIRVQAIQVQPETGRPNTFSTHWQQSDVRKLILIIWKQIFKELFQVNLAKGMDFIPRGDVFARFTHLQHVPYTMNIQVNNESGAKK
jgi:hypothetical protein